MSISKQVLKIDLYNFYLKNRQCEARVKRGVQDTIFPACYIDTLSRAFKRSEIKAAIGWDFLELKHIKESNGMVRAIYVYKVEQLPQLDWWKRSIEKVRGWFNRDYYKQGSS